MQRPWFWYLSVSWLCSTDLPFNTYSMEKDYKTLKLCRDEISVANIFMKCLILVCGTKNEVLTTNLRIL